MKRNINSNRTQKWLKRNDISYDYVRKKIDSHCENLNIQYDIKDNNGSLVLFIFNTNHDKIKAGENSHYEIYLDKKELVLKTIYVSEDKRQVIGKYYKNDCWYKAIDTVANVLYI